MCTPETPAQVGKAVSHSQRVYHYTISAQDCGKRRAGVEPARPSQGTESSVSVYALPVGVRENQGSGFRGFESKEFKALDQFPILQVPNSQFKKP